MKLLITGKNGQLGQSLLRALAPLGEVIGVGRTEMDLSDADAIRRIIRNTEADIVFNAAAYTAVDAAETDRDTAWRVNAEAPGIIGEAARTGGTRVVHFSTDYVFDGTLDRPYRETDGTNPVNFYGESKLRGEEALMSSGAEAMIFRTSWVFAPHGRNFVNTIMRLAQERDSLDIVGDQSGCPTSAGCLAESMAALVDAGADIWKHGAGTYHLACRGEATWHAFAVEIVDRMKKSGYRTKVKTINAIGTEDYPTAARRPHNSRLSSDKAEAELGLSLPDWRIALDQVMKRMAASA